MGIAVKKWVLGLAILLSFLCMLLAAAPFTPAIIGSFSMLLFTGLIGVRGYVQPGIILLFINTLAVIGSPAIDISNVATLVIVLISFSFAFTGVFFGVRKLTFNRVE